MIHDPLSVFVSSDFGQPVTLHLRTGPRQILAIFDNGYFDQELGQFILDTTRKMLTVSASDIEGLRREDGVTFSGKSYLVIEIKPEGTGLAYVMLSEDHE